jgi:TatD DNase family protein
LTIKIRNEGLVDFHVHLDLYPDHQKAVQAYEQAGVYALAVTTTPLAWPQNQALTAGLRFVRPALGLHPQVIASRHEEISLWDEYLVQARYVGEVGLDASRQHYSSFDLQQRIFSHILGACARHGGKILTVHSVRSASRVLDLIEELLPPDRGRVVLHWFSGSQKEASRATQLGCYFSINKEMLSTDRGKSLVASLRDDRILTETDGPFTNVDGKDSRAADIQLVVDALARTRGRSAEAQKHLILDNLRTLCRHEI